jgi:hypothetical protein
VPILQEARPRLHRTCELWGFARHGARTGGASISRLKMRPRLSVLCSAIVDLPHHTLCERTARAHTFPGAGAGAARGYTRLETVVTKPSSLVEYLSAGAVRTLKTRARAARGGGGGGGYQQAGRLFV